MLKILQVYARYLERGGEDVVIDQISTRLASFVELENLQIDTKQWQDECGKGIIGKLRMLLGMYRNPREISRAREHIAKFKPDVILLHNLMPAGSAALLETLLDSGVPVVQYIHNFRPFSVSGYCWVKGKLNDAGLHGNMWPEIISGSWQGSILKTAIYALLLKNQQRKGLYKRIERWIAVSPFMKAKFVQAGIEESKIDVVEHIYQPNNNIVSFDSTASRSAQFVYAGRLVEPKGIKVLLDAWELLTQQHSSAKLFIAGDGPLRKYVEERCKTLSNVDYAGYVNPDELKATIASSLAMIVPSICWESFGLTVYEAFSTATPVLAAAHGSLADLVEHNITGLLHTPGESRLLCEHMLILLRSPQLAAQMGLSAYNTFKSKSTFENWRAQFETCVRETLKNHSKNHEI